jgi:hypothetical protein
MAYILQISAQKSLEPSGEFSGPLPVPCPLSVFKLIYTVVAALRAKTPESNSSHGKN